MKTLFTVIISSVSGFFLGRHLKFRSKNYGVTRKMFLTLERGEIDRKIEIALDLEDYGAAMTLHRKREKLDNKLKRVKKREEKRNARQKSNRRTKS